MRRSTVIVWVLGALLVMSMLDSVRDPPGVNPNTAQCKLQQLNTGPCGVSTRGSDAPSTADSILPGFMAAEGCEPYRPIDRVVHTGQAADPSPPNVQSGRESFFQS